MEETSATPVKPKYLTAPQVAAALGVSPQTIRNWRREGKGPKWHGFEPRTFRYPVSEFEKWVAEVWEAPAA